MTGSGRFSISGLFSSRGIDDTDEKDILGGGGDRFGVVLDLFFGFDMKGVDGLVG